MPDDIRQTLKENGLWENYNARLPYQQNDYIGWITRAKKPETRQNRLNQMFDELHKGGVYMKMEHRGSKSA